ncbi:MAG: HD domain-containing protein [Gammaproteobacteria bacterium]|nr:HD domain-containing protein [Gammaproteobacteria bacterium]
MATKEYSAREKALLNSNRALTAISRTNRVLYTVTDEQEFLDQTCKVITDTRGYLLAWIGVAENDKNKTVTPVAHAGFQKGYLENLTISWGNNKWGKGPTGTAIRTGEIQLCQHAMTNPKYAPWRAMGEKYGFNSSCTFPLKFGDRIAALMIYSEEPEAFDKKEIQLLSELAKDISFGVNTIRTRNALDESYHKINTVLKQTLAVGGGAAEKRDPYTAGHQRRVAILAAAIAKEMGLSEIQIEGVTLGAMVHDIGKIAIPAEILIRPGKLSDLEIRAIRLHPEAGHDLIKNIIYPWPIAQIILQHHERLNGSGYPAGLKAKDIAIEVRIVSVADVVEAMVSHRPYRAALKLSDALKEIEDNKGTLYDPKVVDVCVKLFKKKGFNF